MLDGGNPISIYEKAIPPMPAAEYFEAAKKAGFESVETSIDEAKHRLERLDWSQSQCNAYRAEATMRDVRLMTACLSAHRSFPLGSADPELVKKGMEIFEKATQFCDRMGIRILLVSGFYVYFEEALPDTAKRYEENILKAVKWAEKYGVMYAIEPVELHLTTPTMAREIVRHANSPWLKIYPDAANLAGLGIDPIPEIESCISDSVATHVREALPNFYDNVEFGTGILDWDGLFKMFRKNNYHGPVTLEMWNEKDPDFMNTIIRSREFVENKWNQAI